MQLVESVIVEGTLNDVFERYILLTEEFDQSRYTIVSTFVTDGSWILDVYRGHFKKEEIPIKQFSKLGIRFKQLLDKVKGWKWLIVSVGLVGISLVWLVLIIISVCVVVSVGIGKFVLELVKVICGR